MLTTPRRIIVYWFLLLVPTLAVGGAAIFLLHREQARLAGQSAEAREAQRAAVTARVRLTAETIELTVGDAEQGLLDTLAAEPSEGLDAFLDQWEKDNPLVKITFRSSADGRVLRPDLHTAWGDGLGFVHRFKQQFGTPLPWAEPSFGEMKRQQAEPDARKEVSWNVAQVQSARRDVQELTKTPAYSNASSQNAGIPASSQVASAPGAAPSSALAFDQKQTAAGKISARDLSLQQAVVPNENFRGIENERAAAARASANQIASVANRLKDVAPDHRGWVPATIDGRLHLVGWVQPAGVGEVRGVELELGDALVSRLASALPAAVGPGEAYALSDNQGRILHQVGAIRWPTSSRRAVPVPASRVPLSATLLPGWAVIGYLEPQDASSMDGRSFFWVNALLVAVFIAAILAGGSLLLLQARRSEQEAVQKTSFVANVSHEFKTPLTTIRLYAELLEQGRVRDASQGGEYLRTIGRETERLARLVNNALDFSRLEQGRKKYARESLDLTEALARLLDTHAPRVAEAGLQLERELPGEPLKVTMDRDAFEQIVLNLLDNACKYASHGGAVRVVLAAPPEGGAKVRVSDRGPGVPAEHRALIFEKFHRVDDALTAEKTGAGLGLSIARQLARGLGGELSYAPREGGGAEFILELP